MSGKNEQRSHCSGSERSLILDAAQRGYVKTRKRRSRGRHGSGESDESAKRGGFILYLWRSFRSSLTRLLSSVFLLSLPVGLLLLVSSADFLVLSTYSDTAQNLFFDEVGIVPIDDRRDAAELIKTGVLEYVYVLILLLCAVHRRSIYAFFKCWYHYIVLFAFLLSGVLVSVEPTKVFTNTALIALGILAALLFSLAKRKEGTLVRSVYVVVFVPIMLIHVGSLYTLIYYEVNITDFLLSDERYGGLAGNPNSLGATAVIGFWSAACLLLSARGNFIAMVSGLIGCAVFVLSVFLSGSGTALAACMLVVLALFWLRILSAFRQSTRSLINFAAIAILAIVTLSVLLTSTPAELFLAFTESLGKDATLTGRTGLWAVARDAISVRPFVGWGFDSHASVMSVRAFDVNFNHYHNGYLDTLIAGGVVLLALVFYNLSRFCVLFVDAYRRDTTLFPLIVPFFLLLLLNLSEYSLLRPSSQIWLVYCLAFVVLATEYLDNSPEGSPLNDLFRKRTKRKSKRQLRWA